MKTLILLRHGDASFEAVSDFERPLNDIGIKKVNASALVLINLNISPDKIISSPAERTAESLSIFCDFLSIDDDKIKFIKGLYNRGSDFYLNEIETMYDSVETLLLVGHNPSISDVVNNFPIQEFVSMQPGDLFVVRFDSTSWENIMNSPAQVVFQNPNK